MNVSSWQVVGIWFIAALVAATVASAVALWTTPGQRVIVEAQPTMTVCEHLRREAVERVVSRSEDDAQWLTGMEWLAELEAQGEDCLSE